MLIGIIIGAIGAVIVLMILSAILLWLWNTTVPDVFGLKPLTLWQALALKLLLIATILFGGPTSAAHVTSENRPVVIDQSRETE
jgi:hypothetical protein